jgi:hypothetical protein
MKRLLPLVLLLFPVHSIAKEQPLSDKVWVVIKPVQCLGNRWEKDWLSKHPRKGTTYPIKNEGPIVKSYFQKRGIPILDLRELKYVNGDPLCKACDCPRGDTFYLLIDANNTPKMVALGYSQRLPANAVPDKK